MKYCPHCGSTEAPRVEYNDENDSFAVVCSFSKGGCGSKSGDCDHTENAIIEWNKRYEKTSFLESK